jgi:hypothetical protein
MISSARENFSINNKERSAMNRIFRDVRETPNIHSGAPIRITGADDISSGENDFLIVRASTGTYTTLPLGSVVWGIPRGSVMKGDYASGLYRWAVSGDIQPGSVNLSELAPGNGLLVLPGVKSVLFAALNGSTWEKDFRGARPKALRVTFVYGAEEVSYEELLPAF